FAQQKKQPLGCFFCCATCTFELDYLTTRTLIALIPLGPLSVSNVTLSFSLISCTKPVECTNTSFPPSFGVIKPNPLVTLKNFTFPSCMVLLFTYLII